MIFMAVTLLLLAGAAEGSLNFSLTEPPRRGSDAEELERKPKNLYINAEVWALRSRSLEAS